MFRFASPFAFFLLLPLLAAAWWAMRRRIRQGLLFAPTALIASLGRTWRTRLQPLFTALVLFGAALSIVALARPQKVFSHTSHSSEAIAIMMVADISGSMNALDFASMQYPQRSRLDVVKQTFADFVERRPDDLIGLVTFGGFATSRVPLTIDHKALQHVLEGVEVPRYEYDGREQVLNAEELATAVGDGLATACARIKDVEVKSRVIVLLTDGESNTGVVQPAQATEIARKLGVRVYTIGVGSSGITEAKFNDPQGRMVVARMRFNIDEDLLRTIASTTGGVYFNVRNPKGLAEAMAEIDKLEKTEINREIYSQYDELFPFYLVPGLVLVALGLCLNMAAVRRPV